MRKAIYGLVAIALIFGACKKKNDKVVGGTMTAKVNGVPFTATSINASLTSNGLSFSGKNDTGEIDISLGHYYVSTITYGIDGSTNTADYNSVITYTNATTGTVTAIGNGKDSVQGTFNFTDPGVLQVTDGAFRIRYQ